MELDDNQINPLQYSTLNSERLHDLFSIASSREFHNSHLHIKITWMKLPTKYACTKYLISLFF